MIAPTWRHPVRRAASGVRALGQGLLGLALIALAAFAFLPGASAATVTKQDQTRSGQSGVAGAAG